MSSKASHLRKQKGGRDHRLSILRLCGVLCICNGRKKKLASIRKGKFSALKTYESKILKKTLKIIAMLFLNNRGW